ncbi:MAG: hypothetical protein P4L33_01850 [Capsulimonadaceae bacterium]|nr:hypothetical protein [Capsulimonadaceae bacterium]
MADRAYSVVSPRLAANEDPDAQAYQLVATMLSAQRELSYSGEQVTVIYNDTGPINSSEQTVIHDGLRGSRIEYHSPARLAGESRGDNGKFLWHYIAQKREVQQLPSALDRLRTEIRKAEVSLKRRAIACRFMGEETVAGRRAAVVQVSSTAPGSGVAPGTRRFWIDPVNGAQLRIMIFGPTGNPASDSYFTQITYNPVIAADAFDPPAVGGRSQSTAEVPIKSLRHVPEGVIPVLGFDVLEPAYLPPGYRFENGQIFQYKGSQAFGMRYVNGITVMSLYQVRAPNERKRDQFRINRPGMLTGFRGGIQVVLLGNLDTVELTRVFQSLR